VNAEESTRGLTWLTLATSAGTLLCCALPALLVAVGAGAALASVATNVPQLVWISEHKDFVFALAGSLLVLAGLLQWKVRNFPCPVDPASARACTRARRNSFRVYGFAVVVFLVGGFFAYVAPLLTG
jgi:hypothetical protein